MAQKKVALECSVCGSINYYVDVNVNHNQRLKLKKFCKHCGKHTMHYETR
ncbi:50S ribosomal protein L33 [Philodulcilactobacillus myokoensis]|uniref:Large ribosomal subunit protein bL33 n=1 Tax=Philodulcilactobacillus myokoensis TaxID=2929573 RepID=A0A9W6B258_9LACO|nr:50S ribosomal protein L33 [Philodulcilactobacillus myokoensis]GLB47176.1 50S ribosomal protein L33 [Philodulcilactobacillus myokoensis]